MKAASLLLILLGAASTLLAQSTSGVVYDQNTGETIHGATIILKKEGKLIKGTISNKQGYYRFKNVPEDVDTISVSYLGYNTIDKPLIKSIDQTSLDFHLNSDNITIPICLVVPSHPLRNTIVGSQRGNTLIVDQGSKDLAGTFGDPSRVLLNHTGISTENDQTNSIVYRGLSPEMIKWSVHGAEVVNPNHLSNAGSFREQPSLSAGGVLSFPFESISKFSFHGQPFDSERGNALGGIADFEFDSKGSTFLKFGLLGLEAGYQSQKGLDVKSHLRYSTVGLLSDFGIDFDGERIKFMDAIVRVGLTKRWSLISSIARSTNNKERIKDSSLATSFDDFSEKSYESTIGIAGLVFKGIKSNHTFMFSHKDDQGLIDNLFFSFGRWAFTDRENYKASYQGSHSIRGFRFGLNLIAESLKDYSVDFLGSFKYKESFITARPNLSWDKQFKLKGWDINFSPSYAISYNSLVKDYIHEPSLSLQLANSDVIFELNSNISSQLPSHFVLNQLSRERFFSPQRMNAWNSSISCKYLSSDQPYSISFRAFYQRLSSLPRLENYFPAINGYDFFTEGAFRFNGDGITKGVELMFDGNIASDFYINMNMSLFDTKVGGLNASNNYGFTSNLILTKTFGKVMINTTVHYRGGAYQNDSSLGEEFFQRRLGSYFRADMRAKYTWREKNELILDIQNLTNRQNDAYYYFDPFLKGVVLEKQLTMIPILSYKRIIN